MSCGTSVLRVWRAASRGWRSACVAPDSGAQRPPARNKTLKNMAIKTRIEGGALPTLLRMVRRAGGATQARIAKGGRCVVNTRARTFRTHARNHDPRVPTSRRPRANTFTRLHVRGPTFAHKSYTSTTQCLARAYTSHPHLSQCSHLRGFARPQALNQRTPRWNPHN